MLSKKAQIRVSDLPAIFERLPEWPHEYQIARSPFFVLDPDAISDRQEGSTVPVITHTLRFVWDTKSLSWQLDCSNVTIIQG
jgi:hypothetical protein